jgi:hypothetical protein
MDTGVNSKQQKAEKKQKKINDIFEIKTDYKSDKVDLKGMKHVVGSEMYELEKRKLKQAYEQEKDRIKQAYHE